MDRIAGMEAFAAVVETGGFQSAARQLGVSRALVSKRVAGLERDLGVQLLHRTTRRLSVTGPGSDFYESCRRILGEFELASAQLAQSQQQPRGTLKINAPMSFGQRQLAPALLEFQRRHPAIDIQLSLTDRFVNVVDEGYDLVLRIGALPDSSLIARHLCPVRRVLCAAPAYLDRAGTPSRVDELTSHRLLHYGWLATGARWHLTGPEGVSVVDVAHSFCVNNGDVLNAAAVAGAGIVLLPTFVCGPDLRSGTLVRVLPRHEARLVSLHAVWPASRLLPARLRACVDFLIEWFGAELPAWDRGVVAAADPA